MRLAKESVIESGGERTESGRKRRERDVALSFRGIDDVMTTKIIRLFDYYQHHAT